MQCLVKISKALKCSIEGLARFNSSGGSKLLSILCEQSKFKLTAVVVVVVFFQVVSQITATVSSVYHSRCN